MTTNIKTVLYHPTKGQDIRRLQLASLDKPYDQLLTFLTEIYALPAEKLTIRYRDDDGDDCSISSNIELLEAFRITHQDGRSVLKVDLSIDEDTPSKEESTPGKTEPSLDRSHSESSEEGFVKVEIGDTKDTPDNKGTSSDIKIEPISASEASPAIETATSQNDDLEIKLVPIEAPLIEIAPSIEVSTNSLEKPEKPTESLITTEPQKPTESLITDTVKEEKDAAIEKVPEEPILPENPKQEVEAKPFPSRAEFFSLLSDFLRDAKAMEMVQELLPQVLLLLDEDTDRPAAEILQNVFDFAPAIKANPLSLRLLPFTAQLTNDSRMKPLVKDALRKLHDASKLTAFFRSGPKGSIPYMPDFVRLYNHMSKVVSKCEADEKEEKEIPQKEISALLLQTVIHRGVKCDGCRMFPIQGNRYKCYTCPDYDLCEICEEGGKHPVEHPMLKIRSPINTRQYRCARKSGLPRAHFVEDRTLRDGISCYPGITVLKTWALKNNGEFRWPQGVQLLFLSGDLSPESVKAVPRAEPGATVEVSATIVLPQTPKQYTGYYRLATEDGKKFGPRFWVDVIVVQPVEPVPEKKAEPVPDHKLEEHVAVKKVEPVPEPTPEPTIEKIAEPVTASPQDSSPLSMAPTDIPQLEDVKTDVKKSILEEPKQVETKQSKKEEPKKLVQSPYAAQLETLTGMGFKDAELNAYLLNNNEGNVQRVVEWIISHGVH